MRRHIVPRHSTLMRLLAEVDDASGDVAEVCAGPAGELLYQQAQRAPARARVLWRRFHRAQGEAFAVVELLGSGWKPSAPRHAAGPWEVQLTKDEAVDHALRIFVLETVAELEHFLRCYASWWLTPARILRLRSAKRLPIHGSIAHSESDARRQLVDLVMPTLGNAKTKGTAGKKKRRNVARRFTARLEVVFGVRVPPVIGLSLSALIKWRHEFSHRNSPPRHVDWSQERDFGEVMMCWLQAQIALSNLLVARARQP